MNIHSFCKVLLCTPLLMITELNAQDPDTSLPMDPEVRYGKLSNGLTYYIRKNTYRPHLADFYIAQKVGSILEKPEQRGLAHFLEHMAFNGTTHFPGGSQGADIREWCETVGIKFGKNLNAYTSIDETVYNISDAPVVREGVIDSCLLILHDWSNDLLLTDEEIDKERGVIHEEWRTRQNASMRLLEKYEEYAYKDTKYEDCLPLGHMDVVLNFKYKDLRDYYEKWYRPDLQGIVIVGDIDPDQIEKKIKHLFSDIPAQPNADERIYYPVSDNKEPVVGIFTDKEQPDTEINLFFKHETTPFEKRSTTEAWKRNVIDVMISHMMGGRLSELKNKPDAPFLDAGVNNSSFLFSTTKETFALYVTGKEGLAEKALEATYREMLRAVEFGFLESELSRMKKNYLTHYENLYKERNSIENEQHVDQYVQHFIESRPATSIEYEYRELALKLIPQITLQEVNEQLRAYVTRENRVLFLVGPEKKGLFYPSEQTLLQILSDVEAEPLTAYTENIDESPLVENLPEPGAVIEESQSVFGSTRWKLSNGLTVFIKPTDFKADEVQLTMTRNVGNSVYPDSEKPNWHNAASIVLEGGLGKYSPTDISKKLAGRYSSANTYFDEYADQITGYSTPKDFETLMQFIYLICTSPRKDTNAAAVWKNKIKENIRNEILQPEIAFSDSVSTAIYGSNPRIRRLTESDIDSIDYDRCIQIFREKYSDASDYTVFIVGNVQPDSIRPDIEKYLGALPSLHTKDTWKDTGLRIRKGNFRNHFERMQETEKSSISIVYADTIQITPRTSLLSAMIKHLLSITYTEKVREEEGGTYGVQLGGNMEFLPKPIILFQINFTTNPDIQNKLLSIIYKEIDRFIEQGPKPEDLVKTKEFMLKDFANQTKENSYWMQQLVLEQTRGFSTYNDYENIVKNTTTAELQEFARRLFTKANRYEVIMNSPGKSPAPIP